MQLVRVR
ncbi:hypothetical protein M0802_014133 [Mischocyttarus mexicanus]|nr:hypothetical protein M0802_014138 [Mischocyttarus mexicanus]KAI4480719.1 hypothetical protein M0802_014133 [Mischocyttarus mexicanus]